MYESFYKLRAKPFALSPDPRFFFGSKEHNRVLAYLRYGIKQGEGFIVVTGEVGTGKTTLVGALFSELTNHSGLVAAQLVTTQLGPDDLLRMVSASFGLPHDNLTKSALLKNLESFLRDQHRADKRVLLIVDEAQNLQPYSLEELRMLSNFQEGNRSLLQTFLLGQAEFRQTMRSPNLEQFRQRVIASYHLGPMTKDETAGYIEHRLRVAGWKGEPLFTPAASAAVFDYTDGIPRRINTFCDRVLLVAYLDEQQSIGEETVVKAMEELDGETHYAAKSSASDGAKTTPSPANVMPLAGLAQKKRFVSVVKQDQHPQMAIDPEAQARIEELERRLRDVEDVLDKARAFLQALMPDDR